MVRDLLDAGSGYKPGSYGCHEALHVASMMADVVYTHLREHPAIEQNSEWKDIADKAVCALHELYQVIGREHLKDTESPT